MARRRLEGLERVLGANALFSTAYGNVGSSIYYALGLVASYALGLTPVVFVITGVFFFMTAATYAEATAMYPEAGGSSSFARRAFNEFWSFFAAWAQMLTYVITVAISAFFVPHYIGGLFWEPLRSSPGDIVAGALVIVVLAIINVRGVKESTTLNVLLAVTDFLTQVLLVLVGFVLVLSPSTLIDNVHLGIAPTWRDFILAIPIGMLAYTGIETISNMAEEAQDETKTIPIAINRVRIAVFAIYFTLPAVALSALPVQRGADGEYFTLLGLTEEEGGYAGDPILGVVKQIDLGAAAERGRDLRRPARGHDPLPRHQRGADRRLAARVLDGHPPPAARPAAPAAPEVPDAVDRDPALLGDRDRDDPAGPGGLPRQPLRVRRAALVHVRARFRGAAAGEEEGRSAALPRPGQPDHPRLRRAAVRDRRRDVHVHRVRRDRRAVSDRERVRSRLARARHRRLRVYRRRQGLDLTSTHKVAIAQPVVDHEAEYDSVLVHFGDARLRRPGARDGAQAGGAQAPRDPRARDDHGAELDGDRRADARPGRDREQRHRGGQGRGRQPRSGHVERVRAGQAGRRIVEEAVEMRAAAIVMPLPRRIDGASLFGKTLETVLTERPCRVIIESSPDDTRGGRRPARPRVAP